jgi:RES domain-containing protein
MRASQVHALYLSADPSTSILERKQYLAKGRDILSNAAALIDQRKAGFRVSPERIASWRSNPTVYPFGYVWAATSL